MNCIKATERLHSPCIYQNDESENDPNVGEDAEEPRMLLVGAQNVQLWERTRFLTKVNTPSPGNPATLPLGIYPREMTDIQNPVVFIAAFLTIAKPRK